MANTDKFSVDYFKEALRLHIEKSKDVLNPIQAANSYYRSLVSTIVLDHLNKNFELLRRIRNLDEAYNVVKAEYQQQV